MHDDAHVVVPGLAVYMTQILHREREADGAASDREPEPPAGASE